MTRKDHLDWCKQRALECVTRGDLTGAYASMVSDLSKDSSTANHPALELGSMLFFTGNLNTQHEMKNFIEGFN